MNIRDKEERIRDFISNPRKQNALQSKIEDWDSLCSSLDIIGDTEYAISSYPNICNDPNEGKSYIIIYGILQTLQTQQKAVEQICHALEISSNLPKELQVIRKIRSNSIAHPAMQKENKVYKSNFIQRHTVTPNGFDLLTVFSNNYDYKITHVSIPNLIKIQNEYLGKKLDDVIHELENEEMTHREKHRGKKIVDIFPKTLNYHFSKIFEGTRNKTEGVFLLGKGNLKLIEDCFNNFRSELEERDEWNDNEMRDYYNDTVSYPIEELKLYFSKSSESKLNDKDAYIFAKYLSEQFNNMRKIAEQIDNEYESTNMDG